MGILLVLGAHDANAQSGKSLCQYERFGNIGQPSEYSVPSAQYNLRAAESWLATCDYVNGAPWDACQNAKWHLNQADVKLVQVFTNVANDQERCWTCDPGHRNMPGTLIGAAAVLERLSRDFESRSRQNVTYDNTVFNLESWLDAHPNYCTDAAPAFTSRENIDAATGGLAWNQCNNGHDDDNDGHVDCVDLDCSSAPACRAEPEPHPRHAHCKAYADEAVQLNRQAVNRGCGFEGAMWNNDTTWETHYNWCLSVTGDVSGYNATRRNALNNCE